MNVIVTNSRRYHGWTVVDKLQDVSVMVGEIDFLVYHKSLESAEDCVKNLSMIMQAHPEMVALYVRNKEDMVQAVRILVEGSGGKYIDDEFFLEDELQLNQLTKQWKSMIALTEMSGVSVISDFIHRYLQTGGKGITPGYLQVVKNAAESMALAYKDKSLEVLKLCESASDLFKGSVELIENIQEEQNNLERVVSDLKGKLQNGDMVTMSIPVAPQVGYFPRVSYMKSKVSIVRVKDLGRSPYLTSFMFGFRTYLQFVKKVRPRLIVLEPLGEIFPKVYNRFSWVTQQSKNNMASYAGDVVFTNCPLKDVMDRLLSDPNYDTVIVLDRLLITHQHLLNCAGEDPLYCVKGESFVKELKLNVKRCFSVVSEISGAMFTVPVFAEYPKDEDMRERKYLSECGTFYNMMHQVKLY